MSRAGIRSLTAAVLASAAATVAVIDLGGLLPLPGDGPIGLVEIFAAHLSLVALAVSIPLALVLGTRPLQIAVVVLLVAALVRFGDEWWSPPAAAAEGPRLDVMTWNLEVGSRPPAEAVAFLRGSTASIIALEELTPDVATAIAEDPVLRARYPSQSLFGRDDFLGLGLLSGRPQSEVAFVDVPARLEVVVAADGGSVRVLVIHPLPARIPTGPLGAPIGFEPAIRDGALRRLSTAINQAVADAPPVVVLGDINTASTEPAFDRFTAGLSDAHAEVGLGPGWTYRPSRLEFLGIGLIRIDVVLAGPGLRPIAETTQCPPAGDHCAVLATLARN